MFSDSYGIWCFIKANVEVLCSNYMSLLSVGVVHRVHEYESDVT